MTDNEEFDKRGHPEQADRSVYPQPGHSMQTAGQLRPKVASLDYRGKMRFFKPDGSPHEVLRDLGYSGIIDGKVVWCWGDTLMGTQEHNMICASNTTSIGNPKEPMTGIDSAMEDGHVTQLIPENEEEKKSGSGARWAYGVSNVVEYAPNQGLVFHTKNDRKGGGGLGKDDIRGAAVALVRMDGNVPRCRRVHDLMWGPNEPKYGEVGIAYDSRDKHVYAFGHGPLEEKNELDSRTYLCRAPAEQATNIDAYLYWMNDERKWTKWRHTMDGLMGTPRLTPQQAIFDWFHLNQSAPFWSNYFNKWMLLYGDSWGHSHIYCKTADRLEGPWEDHGLVAKTDPDPGAPEADGFRYCQTGHPWVDDTGKQVLVTWTRANWIWGVMVTWE